MLDEFPDAEIEVMIVWIDMLPSDNEKAAVRSTEIFKSDRRVKQFHDPRHTAGNVFAKNLLNAKQGPAWDVYLFYGPDAEWQAAPPKPVDWMHQLGGTRRADAARFRPRQQLVDSLRETTEKLLAEDHEGSNDKTGDTDEGKP